MGRMVLLRHDLPDGSSHYDWMIEATPGAERLLTFRVSARIDLARSDATSEMRTFRAERLPDHRRAYLEFEGDIGGGRGTVTRVARGEATRVSLTGDDGLATVEIVADWGAGAVRLRGRREGVEWVFEAEFA
ncbi:MAG: hypothetical protein SFY69_11610 [Planctomycetota bacterium]|nr:hypothetical protein [Planctomycetota bacterium]